MVSFFYRCSECPGGEESKQLVDDDEDDYDYGEHDDDDEDVWILTNNKINPLFLYVRLFKNAI